MFKTFRIKALYLPVTFSVFNLNILVPPSVLYSMVSLNSLGQLSSRMPHILDLCDSYKTRSNIAKQNTTVAIVYTSCCVASRGTLCGAVLIL